MGNKLVIKTDPSEARKQSTKPERSSCSCNEITEKELDYFQSETQLSRSEIKEIYNMFSKESKNGELNPAEFDQLCAKLLKNGSKQIVDDIKLGFESFDLNKDGAISFREFIVAYALLQPNCLKKKLSKTFDAFDIDKNGYLDIDEIYVVIKRIYRVVGGEEKIGLYNLKKYFISALSNF
jgi:Ca2+-binding EF-hand superfamily protein